MVPLFFGGYQCHSAVGHSLRGIKVGFEASHCPLGTRLYLGGQEHPQSTGRRREGQGAQQGQSQALVTPWRG